MSVVCAQCSRVNPSEAAYCYHDGAALAGRAGGPINAGTAPFPGPFVFPNGLSCRNFDQLASACQQNWAAATDLLRQGYLGSFFGGMGRMDLLAAAQEAAKFPDLERGLDQLLAKLPTQALQPPKLQAAPSEVNLGQLKIGADRATELHLTNLGMRLVYGTVASDCKWLTLGDGPGHAEKLFQFGTEATIPVQIRGQYLRAGNKPVEGHLTVDSNGGTLTVTFKADVPITPYEGGLFAGAVTPRQIAEKSKANPKEAVPYFENGAMAKWYAANGWAYPVVGPTMPGMGGIQQFFEALGVAKAPKVEFSQKALDLQGAVGKSIETKIDVTTTEKKVVYGWATCDRPWVEIGKTKLQGKIASIPIILRVPNPCPPTLEATIHVMGNGNQKVDVPLKIKVAGGKSGVQVEENRPLPVEMIEDDKPLPVMMIDEQKPLAVEMVEESAPARAEDPFSLDGPAPANTTVKAGPPPGTTTPKPGLPLPVRLVIHLAPLAILLLCLFTPCIHDIFFAKNQGSSTLVSGDDGDEKVELTPVVKLVFDEGKTKGVDYTDSMCFAVHKLNPSGPSVKLNYYDNGFGNSTVARIDGKDFLFGQAPGDGQWFRNKEVDYSKGGQPAGKYPGGKTRTFDFGKGVHVNQTVTLEPSEAVEVVHGQYKRLLNICLARYKIHNTDNKTHKIGLRVLLDTCIGDNDGVPFLLPGEKELVDTFKEFRGAAVPDFIQVLERPDLKDPGIIVQLNLRVGEVGKVRLEPPDRFLLTMYPPADIRPKLLRSWEIPLRSFKEQKDSCVVMYWDPIDVLPKQTRELGFAYGVGNISSAEGGKLAVTVGGAFRKNGKLTVVAYVTDPNARFATLDLPPGLRLSGPEPRTQPIIPPRADKPSPVTWHVEAISEGKQEIVVSTDSGLKQTRRLKITDKSLFN